MANPQSFGNILQVGSVLLHTDIVTEHFACDLDACHGACCREGEAGAPVTLDEIGQIEGALDAVWPELSAAAQAVIDRQGVSYVDTEGDLVTSIVDGRDCVFARRGACYMCTLQRLGAKPVSCALYPIRERALGAGLIGLNYHRWSICHAGVEKGRALGIPVYKFLREPLIRRFGAEWYAELEATVDEMQRQGLIN